jgi:hypothetical protein
VVVSAAALELEQKDLQSRWRVSLSTVRRVLRGSTEKPVRYNGLRPVFTAAQADRIFSAWQASKERTREKMARKISRQRRAERAERKARLISLAEAKGKAKR